MKKSLPVVVIFLAFYLTLGGALASMAQQQTGGYAEAPKDDPAVVAAANFAVTEAQQKEGGAVSLVSVRRAETQIVAGVNYNLCLKVKVNGKTRKVTALVYKTLDDRYTLTSWEPGGCKKLSDGKAAKR
ncbi:MAG: cystatin domain-containing protein [Pyrinomonadaceae bacterium]